MSSGNEHCLVDFGVIRVISLLGALRFFASPLETYGRFVALHSLLSCHSPTTFLSLYLASVLLPISSSALPFVPFSVPCRHLIS
ncbi:hypothetical protein HDK77DRAFT_440817 [Phyllosticta capitalensis]|uniref:Uncharacterized protein n=1 Tax=Phyllosticta capitalensis TaxID=121624 RepID=A0ABR1Z317_9PEZI